MHRPRWFLFALVVVFGCGDDDGGSTDAGRRDDAAMDANVRPDGAPSDAADRDVAEPDLGGPCTMDFECVDSVYCDGEETCAPGLPGSDERGCREPGSPCLEGQSCDEGMGRCTTTCGTTTDADGDGFDSTDCGGDDCDDLSRDVHPGATELCNAIDDDCDGMLQGPDEDDDGDGHADRACGVRGDDCDDEDATVYTDATELCDRVDQDCSRGGGEEVDEDRDGDGFAAEMAACTGGPLPRTDCNDDFDLAHPGGTESCNGLDEDCDGVVDDGADATCAAPRATTACMAGSCTITACDPGYDDCDSSASSGCETELATDEAHCGACGALCVDGATCGSGACSPRYAWDLTARGPATDQVGGLAFDGAGNVFVAVNAGMIDLGGGPLGAPMFGGAFVASYAPDGAHRWSHAISTTSQAFVHAVATDGAGNVYAVGSYIGAITFASSTESAAGSEDAFVVSYDAAGTERWMRSFGTSEPDDGRSVALDAAGNVYVAGQIGGSEDFGGGMRAGLGGIDVWIASFTSAGAHRWSAIHGGDGTDALPYVAATASGGVWLGAQITRTASFGGMSLAAAGDFAPDVVIARYDGDGVHQWSRRYGTTEADRVRAIAVDASARVFVTGDTDGGIDLGGGALPAAAVGYVASFDGSGAHRWSLPIAGTAVSEASIVALGAGDCIVGFSAAGMVQVGSGRTVSAPATGFLARVTAAGENDLLLRLGTTSGSATAPYLARGPGARVVMGGVLRGSVDFGGGIRSSDDAGDLYVLALDL